MYSADAYHPSERPTLKNRRLKVLYHLFMGSFRKTYAYLRMSALNCTLLNSLVAIKFASSLTVFSLRVLRLSLTESRKLFFFFFKPHRQIFFKKSCFFVSIWGIEGVLDTGVWTLDRSRQYFSSKISIAKSL